MNIQNVTELNFDTTVVRASKEKPVLVEFWATWCAPCRLMTPVLEELQKQYSHRITVVKVEADSNVNLLNRFGVANVPTMVLLAGGSVVKRFHGAQPKAALEAELAPWLTV